LSSTSRDALGAGEVFEQKFMYFRRALNRDAVAGVGEFHVTGTL
jgi:hypothetical protein